jgi:hypothetical protein
VPIIGRTAAEAVTTFREHLNWLLARTVTERPLVFFTVGERMSLAFRHHGRPAAATLGTRFGQFALFLGQTCVATLTDDRQYRLRTVSYRYTLRRDDDAEPLLRWEYEKFPRPPGEYCRHHLQGAITLPLPPSRVSLNDMHVPTSFVTIEEVLRFCIVDLGVPPLSGDWHRLLSESYERFKTDFAPRGQL